MARRRGSRKVPVFVLFVFLVLVVYMFYISSRSHKTVTSGTNTSTKNENSHSHSATNNRVPPQFRRAQQQQQQQQRAKLITNNGERQQKINANKGLQPGIIASISTEAPTALECIQWHQTGGCDPNGPLEASEDRPCNAWVPSGSSGFCECAWGVRRGVVSCTHEPFTCEYACRGGDISATQKKVEDLRKAFENAVVQPPLSSQPCVGWRQTGRCDPHGPRESQYDKRCDDLIPDGSSGYCECADGRRTDGVSCEHRPFTCTQLCDAAKEAAFKRLPYRKAAAPHKTRPPARTPEEAALNERPSNPIAEDDDVVEQRALDRLERGMLPIRDLYESDNLKGHLQYIEAKLGHVGSPFEEPDSDARARANHLRGV
eukprot:PhM_4_TR18816/c0_g1_i1/m.35838